MLPNENLAEVFTFFELFDAGAVLLVSRHFADLAVKALRKIPVTRFHRIRLHEYDPELRIYASESRTFDALDEEIIVPVDLLHIAIRNCVIEELALSCMACTALEKSPACPVRAYLQASGKTAVTHCLELRASCFTSSSDLIEFLEPFHGLHVLDIIDDEGKLSVKAIKAFCHRNDIRKLNLWQQGGYTFYHAKGNRFGALLRKLGF